MKDSKFKDSRDVLQSRKCRKLIQRRFAVALHLFLVFTLQACSQSPVPNTNTSVTTSAADTELLTGADQISEVIRICGQKRIGIVANQTSTINGEHLVDTLISSGVNLIRIFGPEHGFRGSAADGEHVQSGIDASTGLPVISLYGKNKKPTKEQVADLDLILFDIQDVGARFYTYISTLHFVMEAASDNGLTVCVLDRPNPNGHYIDGPILDPEFSSFVGMHPVPVVHGMTVCEYALMINGEGWLGKSKRCELKVVPCKNYTHTTKYTLPIKPSPNLPNMAAVYLYPSLAFFEGTVVSVGRGTEKPFQQIGMPGFNAGKHRFTPKSIPGVSTYPPHEGVECKGYDLSGKDYSDLAEIDLSWMLMMYESAPNKDGFFLSSGFFDKLAGTDELREQISSGSSADVIRESWEPGLVHFQKIRSQYLLYPDF